MKIIAFYLPQFHAIPENDEWWGKGFTDWTNVRKASPLFKGQTQPKIPLNHNYYDLSNVDTIKWQAKLASKYNVYGWCIYHYWFNGKLLLEKPAELLLANKDIDISFCFSWANEPWARTWDGKNTDVLMPQFYGGQSDWRKHFEYLLPFFKDKRYIKEYNKPMFVIYKSSSINDCEEMMKYWNQLAIENGFDGIFFVETLKRWQPEKRELPFDAKVEFEPTGPKTISSLYWHRIKRRIKKLSNCILRTKIPYNDATPFSREADSALAIMSPKGTFAGAFIGWDNTPRKGLSGTYIKAPTKEEFKEYLKKKIKIGHEAYGTDYLFINAWNEWAEGTYLEPDVEHKYEYLEAVREVQLECCK